MVAEIEVPKPMIGDETTAISLDVNHQRQLLFFSEGPTVSTILNVFQRES